MASDAPPESLFDATRASTIRHRARIGAFLFCAIWVPMGIFIDPQVFQFRWAGLWFRVPTAAVLVVLLRYLARPRPRRAVERAVTIAFTIVTSAFGVVVAVGTVDSAVPATLSIAIAAPAMASAMLLSWRSTAVLCGISTAMLFAASLTRTSGLPTEYFFIITTAAIVLPIAAFAAASRDRWQASEIEAREHLRQAHEQLRQAHEQLRREERTRTELFINLSHDFRSPLSVIRSEAELLRARDHGSDASLALIDANAGAIVDLIEQVLELARLDHGKAPCAPVSCDVSACARVIGAQLQPSRATTTLAVTEGARGIVALVDPTHLRRILTNLIANALRHVGRAGGQVEVRVDRGEDGAPRVDVVDSGPGIAPEHRATLFDRFASFQPEGSTASGIGLALARELAQLNGGTLACVDATATTFRLSLPAGAPIADAAAEPAMTVPPQRSPAPTDARAVPHGAPVVLLVEDNEDLRGSMIRHLPEFEVVEAWSIATALAALARRRPAAVVCDIMLPDGDGYRLLELVRQGRRFDRIPVLLVSALADPGDRTRGIVAGADDYLAKPFHGEELRARIASAIERAEEQAAALDHQRGDLTMELHDGVCGKLTRAVLLLSSAIRTGATRTSLEPALDEVTQGLAEARGLLDALGVRTIPFDQLVADMRWRIAETCERAGLALEFSSSDDGSCELVPPAAAHALHRIAKEAATNTIRHASATKLRVRVTSAGEELRLSAEDDGGGCAPGWTTGIGLDTVRRRATQHGGGASFGVGETGGFVLSAWLRPMQRAPHIPRSA